MNKPRSLRPARKKFALNTVWAIIRFVLIVGIGYYILYPLLIKFSLAFMSVEDLTDVTVRLIPRHFTLENLKLVFDIMNYPISVLKTMGVSAVITVLQLASCCLVGYGFARYEFPLKSLWFACVILTLIVPPSVIIIPLYLRFNFFDVFGLAELLTGSAIKLVDSMWPSVLMAITGTGLRNGLFIYMIRQFFRNMPKELEESAFIDGAGAFKTFYRIMLPSARPILTTVGLFSFVWQWTDILYSSWFMPDMELLSVQLNKLISSLIMYFRLYGGSYTDSMDMSLQMLYNSIGCLLVILPLLILYLICQKAFVESIERSGIVG